MARSHRIVLKLTDEELFALEQAREQDLPISTATRRILMDRVNWLCGNNRSQKPKRGPTTDTNHIRTYSAEHDHSTAYDYSNSQE